MLMTLSRIHSQRPLAGEVGRGGTAVAGNGRGGGLRGGGGSRNRRGGGGVQS